MFVSISGANRVCSLASCLGGSRRWRRDQVTWLITYESCDYDHVVFRKLQLLLNSNCSILLPKIQQIHHNKLIPRLAIRFC
jgi:hypothetical protein